MTECENEKFVWAVTSDFDSSLYKMFSDPIMARDFAYNFVGNDLKTDLNKESIIGSIKESYLQSECLFGCFIFENGVKKWLVRCQETVVYKRETSSFSASELEALDKIADQVAIDIFKGNLYEHTYEDIYKVFTYMLIKKGNEMKDKELEAWNT